MRIGLKVSTNSAPVATIDTQKASRGGALNNPPVVFFPRGNGLLVSTASWFLWDMMDINNKGYSYRIYNKPELPCCVWAL
jgi:hypothetical protein